MERRDFLVIAGRFGVGSLIAPLVGCGGSESAPLPPPAPPVPAPPPTRTVAYGAQIRTEPELAKIPTVYGKVLRSQASLPSVIDLRSSGFLPPVGMQGGQPSCVAWAVGYATTTFLAGQKASQRPGVSSLQASPSDLYAKLQLIRATSCTQGAYITDACDILIKDKISNLSIFPYQETACPLPGSSKQFGIVGYRRLAPDNSQAIKSALADNKVLPIGAKVYSDFEDFGFGSNRTGVYRISGSMTVQGHAMTLVGYNDERAAYLVMNSWGTDFGDKGFFWFDYNSFTSSVYEVYEVDGAAANVVNPSPTPPAANVQFTNLNAVTQTNPFYGIEIILLNFSLSEPLFVNNVSFVFEDIFNVGLARFQSQQFPVGVWMLQSYVQFWQSLPYRWPPGRYTLLIDGTRQSSQRVAISGSTVYQ